MTTTTTNTTAQFKLTLHDAGMEARIRYFDTCSDVESYLADKSVRSYTSARLERRDDTARFGRSTAQVWTRDLGTSCWTACRDWEIGSALIQIQK